MADRVRVDVVVGEHVLLDGDALHVRGGGVRRLTVDELPAAVEHLALGLVTTVTDALPHRVRVGVRAPSGRLLALRTGDGDPASGLTIDLAAARDGAVTQGLFSLRLDGIVLEEMGLHAIEIDADGQAQSPLPLDVVLEAASATD